MKKKKSIQIKKKQIWAKCSKQKLLFFCLSNREIIKFNIQHLFDSNSTVLNNMMIGECMYVCMYECIIRYVFNSNEWICIRILFRFGMYKKKWKPNHNHICHQHFFFIYYNLIVVTIIIGDIVMFGILICSWLLLFWISMILSRKNWFWREKVRKSKIKEEKLLTSVWWWHL